MRYAFLHKNFRELNLEKRVIFIAHFLTMIFCFFPWFEADSEYVATFTYNAFSGAHFLLGSCIFVISLLITIYFLDRMFESEKVPLPISQNTLFFGASLQQILLIVLAWSVIVATGKDFGEHAVRFGIFLAFVAQIAALVATFLNAQLDRQQQARSFFKNPSMGHNHQE